MTTALTPGFARSSSARVSSSVRNAKTPSFSMPSIGGIRAELPVASSSVSNEVTWPSSVMTTLRSASTSVTRAPTRRRILLRQYHSGGLSVISSAGFSPASTDESRMRL